MHDACAVGVGTNPTDEGAVASRGERPAQETEKQCARGSVQAQKKRSSVQENSVQETVCKGQSTNPNQIDT